MSIAPAIKEFQLSQLAISTSIISQELPWEYRISEDHWMPGTDAYHVLRTLDNGYEIRIQTPSTPVPLGASDIPPGSVISKHPSAAWFSISWLGLNRLQYIGTVNKTTKTFTELRDDNWQINRSIPVLGKWDPAAWEPCSKLQQS